MDSRRRVLKVTPRWDSLPHHTNTHKNYCLQLYTQKKKKDRNEHINKNKAKPSKQHIYKYVSIDMEKEEEKKEGLLDVDESRDRGRVGVWGSEI